MDVSDVTHSEYEYTGSIGGGAPLLSVKVGGLKPPLPPYISAPEIF